MSRLCQMKKMRALACDISGNVAILGVLGFSLTAAVAAFAVDLGSLYLERRQAQSVTDLTAIIAAANLDRADIAALAVLEDNGQPDVVLAAKDAAPSSIWNSVPKAVEVTTGRYTPDPDVDPGSRFEAGGTPQNAVQVIFRTTGTLYFAQNLIDPPVITTTAIATRRAEAAFSIGSRLLSLNAGILNALLGKLLGANLSLNVMDYQALLAADVSLLSFLDVLATELDIDVGTHGEVLDAEVALGVILKALATVGGHDQQTRIALTSLLNRMPLSGGGPLKLGKLLDLGGLAEVTIGQASGGLDAVIGVMDIVGVSAALANGTNQIKLDTGIGLPGLLDVSVDLAIGEPPQGTPWFAIGEPGTLVRTAQTRLRVSVSVGGSGFLLGTAVRLPLYLEIASAEARLKSISCPVAGNGGSVEVDARPGVLGLWVGNIHASDLSEFGSSAAVQPARLVVLPILKVTGAAQVHIGNDEFTRLRFSSLDIRDGIVKSVSTRNVTQSLTQSLLGSLQLGVNIDLGPVSLGLIVPPVNVIKDTVLALLSVVTAPVDALLYNLLSVLGIKVGEAEVRVRGLNCHHAVLVQ
jgi:uncharacterized membrane protein